MTLIANSSQLYWLTSLMCCALYSPYFFVYSDDINVVLVVT